MRITDFLNKEAEERAIPVSFKEEYSMEHKAWFVWVTAKGQKNPFAGYSSNSAEVYQLYLNYLKQFRTIH